MDRLTRKELKSDRFALEVQHSVEYVSEHRKQLERWGTIAGAALVIILAVYGYMRYQHGVREEALQNALQIQNAQVGPQTNEFTRTFATEAEKNAAAQKVWTDLAAKYPGTEVGVIAEYYLGAAAADKGNIAEAERRLKVVADSGKADYASLAKLSLAQVYASEGKADEAEKLARSVMDHPTALVSKDQATLVLAQLIAKTKPQEARKLLEPLRASDRRPISQAALTALSEMPK